MPGHPDGQNYAIWRGPDFFANPTFNLSAANPANAQGQVTNYASLVVNIAINNPGGASFSINWFTDSTQTVPLGSDGFDIPNGFHTKLILPCLGNFVTVRITTPDVAATASAISIYPTNTPAARPQSQDVSWRIQSLLTSIGAGATVLFPLLKIAPGQAHLYAQDVGSSTKLSLQVVELDKGQNLVAILYGAAAPFVVVQSDFAVTTVPLALRIINSDGVAAHNFAYYFSVVNLA